MPTDFSTVILDNGNKLHRYPTLEREAYYRGEVDEKGEVIDTDYEHYHIEVIHA